MFVGDIRKIKLGTSSFESIITSGSLYIDKSLFIEHFLNEAPDVQLIARQRRLGKSLNLDMLKCFLTDRQDYRPLFEALSIRKSPVWESAHSAPVFLFDFKGLSRGKYITDIKDMIEQAVSGYVSDPKCPAYLLKSYMKWETGETSATNGIKLLTAIVHAVTGKKPYVLIDEYDEMLTDNMENDCYDEIREFMSSLLSAGLKGNEHLQKGLLTGVMRISYEGMLSGLNNLQTYDVFRDNAYAVDYGLTEYEVGELSEAAGFDRETSRQWYNGIKIGGHAIYNTYGVMSMIHFKSFDCYWAASGTMETITSIMNARQKRTIIQLLEDGVKMEVGMEEKISPRQLFKQITDSMFYSFLVQAGYLSLEGKGRTTGSVAIPNLELKDVWERFLLSNFYNNPDIGKREV